jgi:hypothetical protein
MHDRARRAPELGVSRQQLARAFRRGSDNIEDFGSDSGEDSRIQSAGGPFVEQDLGAHREALARDALLPRELVDLPRVVEVGGEEGHFLDFRSGCRG